LRVDEEPSSPALGTYIKDTNPALAKEIFDAIPSLQKHFASK
jgi:hypothetical protein